mmetsp:Transcript_9648/g.30533  ORF Transcript_9648/g.30533 Transcript_9648/m.30533 type:complete len:322 (-) Transcript_9648:90-1055(-)
MLQPAWRLVRLARGRGHAGAVEPQFDDRAGVALVGAARVRLDLARVCRAAQPDGRRHIREPELCRRRRFRLLVGRRVLEGLARRRRVPPQLLGAGVHDRRVRVQGARHVPQLERLAARPVRPTTLLIARPLPERGVVWDHLAHKMRRLNGQPAPAEAILGAARGMDRRRQRRADRDAIVRAHHGVPWRVFGAWHVRDGPPHLRPGDHEAQFGRAVLHVPPRLGGRAVRRAGRAHQAVDWLRLQHPATHQRGFPLIRTPPWPLASQELSRRRPLRERRHRDRAGLAARPQVARGRPGASLSLGSVAHAGCDTGAEPRTRHAF